VSAVWVFDVDGTLIGSVRSDMLRPGAAALLDELAARGATCVLWSAGGADYARRVAVTHGLADRVDGYYAKPDRRGDTRYGVDHFASHHRPAVFVDDSPGDLPDGATVVAVPQFIGGNPADRALVDLLDGLRAEPSRPAPDHSPRVAT
jgi:phosphoglycolate phosphatase-like HAD superfamily hydrolase